MKREIKFRAWDKKDNRMIVHEQDFIPVRVTSMGVLKLNPHHEESFWEFMDAERFELMQFSGFKDKNGREVYEGDVIVYGTDIPSAVMFENQMFCVPISGGFHNTHLHIMGENNKWMVVGNIYENPELLNLQL